MELHQQTHRRSNLGSKNFEYAKVTDWYFISLGLNPLNYIWLLITKRKILPAVFGRKIITKLLKAKLLRKHEMNLLRIPVSGTWCRRLRTGDFKVFDIPRSIVTRVYNPETSKNKIKKQIELFTRVGHLEFAPDLKCWNIDEGWYEEEFIKGVSGHGLVPKDAPKIVMDHYYTRIEPLLGKMIFAEPPTLVTILSYIEKFENPQWIGSNTTDNGNRADVLIFIQKMASRCKELIHKPGAKIYLALSHGDFHQFNMIWTGSVLKLIDWEDTQKLSLLFDFYNFFFSQLYLQNSSLDYPNEIQKGIVQLASRISIKCPPLAENILEYAELYRLVYYVERIYTFITSFDLDNQRMQKWIEAFQKFEETINGSH